MGFGHWPDRRGRRILRRRYRPQSRRHGALAVRLPVAVDPDVLAVVVSAEPRRTDHGNRHRAVMQVARHLSVDFN